MYIEDNHGDDNRAHLTDYWHINYRETYGWYHRCVSRRLSNMVFDTETNVTILTCRHVAIHFRTESLELPHRSVSAQAGYAQYI